MQQFASARMLDPLDTAIEHRNMPVLKVLLRLPEAQQLTASSLSVLLVCAVEWGIYEALGLLTQTTAAQQLGGDELVKPLQLSLETPAAGITTTCLLELPGLQLLPVASVVQLLQSALSAVGGSVADKLVQLPAMQQLASAQMLDLLGTATTHRNISVLKALSQLPASKQVTADQLAPLLSSALQSHQILSVKLLLDLPAANHISVNQLSMLVEAALGAEETLGAAKWLLQIPAAAELSPAAVTEFLQRSLQNGTISRAWAVWWLVGLPGAQLLSIEEVGYLLGLAVEQGLADPVAYLARLPAAAEVSGVVAEELLEVAVQQKAVAVVRALVQQLPPVGGVTVDKLMQLLGRALGSEEGGGGCRGMAPAGACCSTCFR